MQRKNQRRTAGEPRQSAQIKVPAMETVTVNDVRLMGWQLKQPMGAGIVEVFYTEPRLQLRSRIHQGPQESVNPANRKPFYSVGLQPLLQTEQDAAPELFLVRSWYRDDVWVVA